MFPYLVFLLLCMTFLNPLSLCPALCLCPVSLPCLSACVCLPCLTAPSVLVSLSSGQTVKGAKRGRHTREYVLNITETNTQSKAVLSHVMTVIDKTDGWEDEEQWSSKSCGMHVGPTPKPCCVTDRNALRIGGVGSHPSWKAFFGSAKKLSKNMSGCQNSSFPCKKKKSWWL